MERPNGGRMAAPPPALNPSTLPQVNLLLLLLLKWLLKLLRLSAEHKPRRLRGIVEPMPPSERCEACMGAAWICHRASAPGPKPQTIRRASMPSGTCLGR